MATVLEERMAGFIEQDSLRFEELPI